MNNAHHINFIKREAIDVLKYDRCIEEAENGLIYACSFYLDCMASHWDALVMNDYEAVMPLVWNKKVGIKYLYQPPFTQQLGIFGNQAIDIDILESFIAQAKSMFNFAEIFLNSNNSIAGTKKKSNYILSLNSNYENIRVSYKKNLTRNLEQAKKHNLVYASTFSFREAIDLFITQYGKQVPHVSRKDYKQFFNLCVAANTKNMIIARKVASFDNELLSIALFLKDKKRLYNVMPVTLLKGRRLKANHFLLDELIREFSGGNLTLDFEGSDLEGVARFYQQFGAVNEPYFFMRYNHLPFPIKYLKKQ